MASGQSMYLLREIGLGVDDLSAETHEYEVITDAETVGEAEYGPFYFTVWELGSDRGGEQALCLRVNYEYQRSTEERARATSKGYYHGGGTADEIVILSSLFLRRRMRLGRVVRLNNLPRMYDLRHRSPAIDQELTDGTVNLQSLVPWFELIRNLQPEYHQRFILSAKFYQQALQQSKNDSTTAYLSLVSAIEVLSGNFDIGEVTIADLHSSFIPLVQEIADEDLRHRLVSAMLNKERFIKRRFREFVIHYVDDSFFREPGKERLRTIQPSDLPSVLNRVYDQRSSTLHAGEAFPPYIDRGSHRGEDLPLGLSVMSGDREWDTTAKAIPLLHAFERLTRHVLLNFLRDKCGVSAEEWKMSLASPKDLGAR